MSNAAKAGIYTGLAVLTAALAYAFFAEHARVLHQGAGASRGLMMTWLGALLLSAGGLALWFAYDMTQRYGWRLKRWLAQGGRSGGPAPELDEAAKLRAKGEPLDAIRVLREYITNNPSEVEVMSKIAEIYKDDLSNYLAAALEYEELLKHKLPKEQWAWAALHLAKLYGRLNEPEKAVALLERIDNECGQTVAARRARKAREQMGGTGQEAGETGEAPG